MYIEREQILRKLTAPNKSLEALSRSSAKRSFEGAKRRLMGNFRNHPVVQELEGGPTGGNITGTLSRGNLFAFIGFQEGSNPTEKLEEFLDENIQFNGTLRYGKPSQMGTRLTYQWEIKTPFLREIWKETPYPSEKMTGSWADDLEGDGIPNFGQFWYFSNGGLPNSRSGTGLQRQNSNFSGSSQRTDFIRKLMEDFKEDVQ